MNHKQTIGYLQYQVHLNTGVLSIQNKFDRTCSLNIALLDEKGRVIIEQNIKQSKNNASVQLEFPALKVGNYNAWIQMNGKTYLRQLSVEKTASFNWLSKVKQKLFDQPLQTKRSHLVLK